MKDILQQIQSLKEDFMNLIEVEGLGQPATDVPPSQNKIKKDRKTKNGKVELVSVEDELFPYDGNKREQYREKIINTINNMIQGTATLDDLLQVVRSQKKMPMKEGLDKFETAIGILEEMINEVTREDRFNAALNFISGRSRALRAAETANGPQQERRNLRRKLMQAINIINTNGEGGEVTSDIGTRTLSNGSNEVTRKIKMTPLNRSGARKKNDPRAGNTISWAEHEKAREGVTNESFLQDKLEEALKILEGWAKDKRPEAAKKSIDGRRREYLNRLAHVLDVADIYGSENVPDGDVKDLDRAEGRYAHAKKVSKIEEALSLIEGIHTAIEKGAHEIKKPMLHAKAIMNYSNELQDAAKKELPKNKKNSFKAINDKMNEIAKKRGISPVDDYVNGNKLGEA